jgi:Leucine-rich repeat (LRR) protein
MKTKTNKFLAILLSLAMFVGLLAPMSALAGEMTYNANDVAKLTAFANQGTNLASLGWDLLDPSSWNYVTWIESDDEEYRLGTFDVYDQSLTLSGDLDLSGCTELYYLDFDNDTATGDLSLTSLNLSGCTALESFYCNDNITVTSVNVSGCTSLERMFVSNNIITSLNLSDNTALARLVCYKNKLTSLDLSKNTLLTDLECYKNNLTELDVTGITGLTTFDCSYNSINLDELTTPGTYVKGINEVTAFVEWDALGDPVGYFNFSPQRIDNAKINANDLSKLKAFANQGNNLASLGWDLDDPSSWDYVYWTEVNDEYRLEAFGVYDQDLTLGGSLDLSGCTELVYLDFDGDGSGNLNLTSLNVSGCAALEALFCDYNQLSSLNLSDCAALEVLSCDYNQLSSLDLSDCTALIELNFRNNNLTSIDLSANINLYYLNCRENKLASLNLSSCTKLEELYCYKNQLKELDLTGLTDLYNVNLSYNYMSMDEVDTPGTCVKGINDVTAFVEWDAEGTPYGYFGFSPQRIENATYNANDLAKLKAFANQGGNRAQLGWDLSDPENWDYVYWTPIGTEYHLEAFEVYNQNLTLGGNLDLSDCTELVYLDFDGNGVGDLRLTSLNLSGCAKLEGFYCNNNYTLASLDVSGCSKLEYIYCYENQLTSLNLTGRTELEELICDKNQLTSLDVSGCSALTNLECDENQLTSLNLTGCSELQNLSCYQNRLTELDVTGLINLMYITCSYNYMNEDELTAPGTCVTGIDAVTNFNGWNADGVSGGYFSFSPQHAAGFKAVTKIANLPTKATINKPLTLSGTVVPADATNKTITWEIDWSETGVNPVIENGVLTAIGVGWIDMYAVVENGHADGEDYVQYFAIYVSDRTAGDADDNGKINSTDAVMILRNLFWTGAKQPTINTANADVDGNGKVNATDATTILRHLFWTGDKQPPLL